MKTKFLELLFPNYFYNWKLRGVDELMDRHFEGEEKYICIYESHEGKLYSVTLKFDEL